jgi:DNA-directed RNA polymerase subunit RPC12/RpoP
VARRCPTCGVPMTGVSCRISARAPRPRVWVDGPLEFGWTGNVELDGKKWYALESARCPECGLVQLYATRHAPPVRRAPRRALPLTRGGAVLAG